MTKRDFGADITRILAFISVPGVHFFLNSGYYDELVVGKFMFLMTFIRTFFMICVPLFMILTGYLMAEKEINLSSKKLIGFYLKLKKIIITYLLCTLLIILYRVFLLNEQNSIYSVITNIFSYSQYSWYVEMYLAFYLFIPYLLLFFNNIKSKQDAKFMIIILCVITTLPSITNIWNFSNITFLIHPSLSNDYLKVLPSIWSDLYPFTYFMIGAYLKRYVNIKELDSRKIRCYLIICLLLFTAFNYWRSGGNGFKWGAWNDWGGFENVVDSVLVFLLINSHNYNCSEGIGHFISKVSTLTFGGYILSWIPDNYFYPQLNERITNMHTKYMFAPVMIVLSVITALILSLVVDCIINLFSYILRRLQR